MTSCDEKNYDWENAKDKGDITIVSVREMKTE
jgi:hypothetical protein